MALLFLSPIHKAGRQIALHLEPRLRDLEVSNPEGHLISYLRSYGPCPVAQIRAVFGFKGSTLTGILDRLQMRGLLVREILPEDRRSYRLGLTPEGRRLGERIQRHLDALEAGIRTRVRPADLEGFRNVMAAIAAATRQPGTTYPANPE